jgi:hypothetical protein
MDDHETVFESNYGNDSVITKTLTPPVSRFNIKLLPLSNSEKGKLKFRKESFIKFGTSPKGAVITPIESRGERVYQYQEEMEAIRRKQEEAEEACVEKLQHELAYLTASLQNEAEDKVSTRPKFNNPSQAMDSSVSEEQEEYSSKNCPEISFTSDNIVK